MRVTGRVEVRGESPVAARRCRGGGCGARGCPHIATWRARGPPAPQMRSRAPETALLETCSPLISRRFLTAATPLAGHKWAVIKCPLLLYRRLPKKGLRAWAQKTKEHLRGPPRSNDGASVAGDVGEAAAFTILRSTLIITIITLMLSNLPWRGACAPDNQHKSPTPDRRRRAALDDRDLRLLRGLGGAGETAGPHSDGAGTRGQRAIGSCSYRWPRTPRSGRA